MTLSQRPYDRQRYVILQIENSKVVKPWYFAYGLLTLQGGFRMKQNGLFAVSEGQSDYIVINQDALEQVSQHPNLEDLSLAGSPSIHFEGGIGKPGLISFYNRPYKREDEINTCNVPNSWSSLVWLVVPAVLVASFIFPSLYLRRIIFMVFEDSLMTDFLILFFTEALFCCGVAVFILLIDCLRRPIRPYSLTNNNTTPPPQLGQRISCHCPGTQSYNPYGDYMGFVWPWTGPVASATFAPYLVGGVVQFAFEQYARYQKSPSWTVIPIVFQVYRLHQLNKATQLVTALSFTVRGTEVTSHNLAINNSLGTLLNVLQLLGVICIWSLSSFLMRFFPPTATSIQ